MQRTRRVVSQPASSSNQQGWRRVLKRLSPYLYLAPALTFIGLFVVYPLFRSVQVSFYQWNLVSPRRTFVGLENYRFLVTDPWFGEILWQSVLLLGLALLGVFVLPIALAMLTVQLTDKEVDLYQSLIFLPTVIAVNIAVLVWIWFFLPAGGFFNSIVTRLGAEPIAWLSQPRIALPAVSLVANWKVFGFHFLIALAGVRAIPKTYLEAAYVDGAEGWTLMRRIILPLFAPTGLFLFVITMMQGLEYVFVPIDVMTSGGPAGATNNIMYAIYQEGFKYFRAGYASALSVILIVLFGGLIYWQYRLFESSVRYDR